MIINVDNIEAIDSLNRVVPPRFIVEIVMVSGNKHELKFDILEDRDQAFGVIAKNMGKILEL